MSLSQSSAAPAACRFGDPLLHALSPMHPLNGPGMCLPLPSSSLMSPVQMSFPARSSREAVDTLAHLGNGVLGSGFSQTYLGMAMPSIRDRYYQALERAAAEISAREREIGMRMSDPNVRREFVKWASEKRTSIARLYRIPMGPGAMIGGELRDWRKYGVGGRSFGNLESRAIGRGLTQDQAWARILNTVDTPNPQVTAAAGRTARLLRGGGAVLIVGGVALSGYEIYQARPEDRPELVKRAAATTGASTVASGLAIGFAVMLGATGIGLIAIGIVAGVAASYGTERVFFAERPDEAEALKRHGFVESRFLTPVGSR
jgi:hypothetical protein